MNEGKVSTITKTKLKAVPCPELCMAFIEDFIFFNAERSASKLCKKHTLFRHDSWQIRKIFKNHGLQAKYLQQEHAKLSRTYASTSLVKLLFLLALAV